jgi:hypothetical protein
MYSEKITKKTLFKVKNKYIGYVLDNQAIFKFNIYIIIHIFYIL